MRLMIFKTKIVFNNEKELIINVAAREINDLPGLIEKNKPLYKRDGMEIASFSVIDTLITLGMSYEQYEQEIMFCEIVQDDDYVIPESLSVNDMRNH